MNAFVTYHPSPIGILEITGSDEGIAGINFTERDGPSQQPDHPLALKARAELQEYMTGERTTFDLPLVPKGTMFQQTVWNELVKIPYGSLRTYMDIALAVGNENMIRAVGTANGRNPIAIVIPCHRVIGSDGSLTGYAGGLWRKRWLLDLEQSKTSPRLFT